MSESLLPKLSLFRFINKHSTRYLAINLFLIGISTIQSLNHSCTTKNSVSPGTIQQKLYIFLIYQQMGTHVLPLSKTLCPFAITLSSHLSLSLSLSLSLLYYSLTSLCPSPSLIKCLNIKSCLLLIIKTFRWLAMVLSNIKWYQSCRRSLISNFSIPHLSLQLHESTLSTG